jgi:hypothetical protein
MITNVRFVGSFEPMRGTAGVLRRDRANVSYPPVTKAGHRPGPLLHEAVDMTTEGARHVAYADLVGGLLDARLDPATERFDAELKAAIAAGTVTADAARTLRFWQRASIRGLVEHARHVLPPALGALEVARDESQETVEAERQSWAQATGTTVPDPAGPAGSAGPAGPAGPADPTAPPAPAVTPSEAGSINLTDHRRNRLIVAGLKPSPAPDDADD